jgi:pyruvate/2-oxoglutarate dehydrogenase complex dihydrolipoamide acyltransferase (E2) component
MADTVTIFSPIEGTIEVWKTKAKNTVKKNDVLCIVGGSPVHAKVAGELLKVCVEVGGSVGKGDVLALIAPCQHPAILFHMCVACGERVAEAAAGATSALSLNGGQQLQLTQQEAAKVQTSKLSDLLRIKKLALILDLDHTLVHAMEISGSPPAELEEGVELLLLEDGVPPQPQAQTQTQPTHALGKTVVKHHLLCKRPHLDWFLEEAHKFCQMTIYTAGTRRYAEAVARIIDPTG